MTNTLQETGMRERMNPEFSITDALNMYLRLRLRGQNSTLARLSVEARCGNLTPEQRNRVRQVLREKEASVA
jgi:hypothetical protein